MSNLYDRLIKLTRTDEGRSANSASNKAVEEEPLRATVQYGSRRSKGGRGLRNYNLIRVVGNGSFAKVVLAQNRETQRPTALKIMSKDHILAKNIYENVLRERAVLSSLNSPFIVKLENSFQTARKVFMALEFCDGGELYYHMQNHEKFPSDWARFYFAEVAFAFMYIHQRGICFRDIKPENILMDGDGHVKLSDFGMIKTGVTEWLTGGKTMCGTPQYMAPEVFLSNNYGLSCDWWSLGIVFYEMLTGIPPYRGNTAREVFSETAKRPLVLLRAWSDDLKDFLRGILYKHPDQRLGAKGGAAEVLSHPYFHILDIKAVQERTATPPIIPNPVRFDELFDAKDCTDPDAFCLAQPELALNVNYQYIDSHSAANFDSIYASDEANRGTTVTAVDPSCPSDSSVDESIDDSCSEDSDSDNAQYVVCSKKRPLIQKLSRKVSKRKHSL